MPVKPPGRQYKSVAEAIIGQRVGLADDEGSIISHPSKTATCGACRTRDSRTWWKAPKGLSTSILCDTCGTNWRKYADLNVRPIREESLPATAAKKVAEKREGTPLAGPVAKRARVCVPHKRERAFILIGYLDVHVRSIHTSAGRICCPSATMHVLSQERSFGQSFEVQAMRVPGACR